MSDAAEVLGLTHLCVGLLLVVISVPLILERIPMNRFYGVRIAKAFESDAHWYAINAFGGRVLAWAGAITALLGVVVLLRPPRSELSIVLVSLAPAPVVLLAMVPILRFAKRLR